MFDALAAVLVVSDIRELISLEDVMAEMKLGPNGGLIYCMEYLVDNIDWLEVLTTPCARSALASRAGVQRPHSRGLRATTGPSTCWAQGDSESDNWAQSDCTRPLCV